MLLKKIRFQLFKIIFLNIFTLIIIYNFNTVKHSFQPFGSVY